MERRSGWAEVRLRQAVRARTCVVEAGREEVRAVAAVEDEHRCQGAAPWEVIPREKRSGERSCVEWDWEGSVV